MVKNDIDSRKQGTINLFSDLGLPGETDQLDLSKWGLKEGDGNKEQKFDIGQLEDNSDDEEDFMAGGGKKDQGDNDQDNGIIVDMENIDTLYVTKKNKEEEDKDRKNKIEDC